ncbi:MAG: fructosamine kinase [Actinobacteria bacterium]|nr:fructosamine kinase [Actinomycetota bacterium]
MRTSPYLKSRPGLPAEAYRFEAAGLRWLSEGEFGPRVPRILDVEDDRLVLETILTAPATASAAKHFGRSLVHMHALGADSFGELPPGSERGFIASLDLPAGEWETFGSFYAQGRIRPFLDHAGLTSGDRADLERLADVLESESGACVGPRERVARVHGDLWSGNVLWRKRDAVVIDPSAHGGHRLGDLAMLALFGAPWLEEIFEGYESEAEEVWPLWPGWRSSLGLHQIYPLLVHAVLFGGSYPAAAGRAARTVLGD